MFPPPFVRRTVAPTLLSMALALFLFATISTTARAQVDITDVSQCGNTYICNGSDTFELVPSNTEFPCQCVPAGTTGPTYNPLRRCENNDGCFGCDDANVCLRCNPGYVLNNGTCILCVVANCQMCYPGDGNQCQVCTAANWTGESACDFLTPAPVGTCGVAHCDVCVDNVITQCAQCTNYFTLDTAGVGLCESECAVPGCQICQPGNSQECAVCQFGYDPNNGTCTEVGFNNTGCRVNYCATCEVDNATCQECVPPRSVTSQGYCSLCPDPYCAVCAANGTCIDCFPGFAPNATGSCVAIPCNVPECLYCVPGNPNQCEVCAINNGTVLSDGTCVEIVTLPPTNAPTTAPQPCNVYNCKRCRTGNPNRCDTCSPGYTLNSLGGCGRTGACNVYNCLQCQAGLPNRCYTCRNGYGITTAYTCVKLRSGGTTVIISGALAAPPTLVAALLTSVFAFVVASL